MRSQRGQGTVEYLGLVAALAVLLAAAATLAGGGAGGIANAVLAQVRHALCIVTGRACFTERAAPCVVSSERDARHVSVTVLVLRLDGDRYVFREKLSDGSVRLTLAHRAGAGVELGVGGRATIKVRGRTVGIDDELRGGGEGVLGYGDVYVARSDDEAARVLRAIRHRIPLVGSGGPDPSARFVEGGTRGLGRIGIGGSVAGLSLEALSESVVGGRRDERTGDLTITLNAGSAGWALLSSLMAGPAGTADRQVAFALTLDRDRRPRELALAATGSLAAGAALPPGLASVLGHGLGERDPQVALEGRRWELGAQLDLRDPEVAAAWSAFRRDPADGDAIRALAAAVRTRAHLDARTYAVSGEADGAAAGLAAGARLGGEIDHVVDRARLIAAASRPPGGLWEQRADCVPA